MSKRVLFGGLAALAVALFAGGSAQAQYRVYGGGGGGWNGGGHYHAHGNHLHYHNPSTGFYSRPIYNAPIYSPIVVAPRPVVYSGINSPYFGFGNAGYPFNSYGGFGQPIYGGGYGYGGGSVLNIGLSRPGFGISFGTIIR